MTRINSTYCNRLQYREAKNACVRCNRLRCGPRGERNGVRATLSRAVDRWRDPVKRLRVIRLGRPSQRVRCTCAAGRGLRYLPADRSKRSSSECAGFPNDQFRLDELGTNANPVDRGEQFSYQKLRAQHIVLPDRR